MWRRRHPDSQGWRSAATRGTGRGLGKRGVAPGSGPTTAVSCWHTQAVYCVLAERNLLRRRDGGVGMSVRLYLLLGAGRVARRPPPRGV